MPWLWLFIDKTGMNTTRYLWIKVDNRRYFKQNHGSYCFFALFYHRDSLIITRDSLVIIMIFVQNDWMWITWFYFITKTSYNYTDDLAIFLSFLLCVHNFIADSFSGVDITFAIMTTSKWHTRKFVESC